LLLNVCIAISQGLNSPNLLTLVSKQATPNQQGETLGINQSMQSLAQFIPPILVGFFGENLNVFPFLIGGLSIVLAWVILVFLLIPLMKKAN
jgi:DHA1 family tetracycline resistance protein-like MFS transporter